MASEVQRVWKTNIGGAHPNAIERKGSLRLRHLVSGSIGKLSL